MNFPSDSEQNKAELEADRIVNVSYHGLLLAAAVVGVMEGLAAVLCLMAAVNVAVTRTPVSTTVLLGTLSGTASIPLVLAASLTSFLLSSRIRMINTQRSRTLPGSLTWRETEKDPR